MRPLGSAAQLEARRRRAVDLLADRKSLTEVAKLVGADVSSVKRWKRAWKQGGDEALNADAEPWSPVEPVGRAKTTVDQDRAGRSAPGGLRYGLVDVQTRGGSDSPRVRRDVPSGPRRSSVACFGLYAAEATASRFATQRGGHRPLANARLAADQKKALRQRATVVFLDETGFLLQPVTRRTWAPARARRPYSTFRLGTTACPRSGRSQRPCAGDRRPLEVLRRQHSGRRRRRLHPAPACATATTAGRRAGSV